MTELREIQGIELDILEKVTNILDANGLKWYLIGGSCLGAVRHNGFIPWDDDIDIGLFRDDYNKARKVLKKYLPDDYLFCDRTTESEYPYNFAKVRKRNTAYVQDGYSHLNIHLGIYIDIFPFDFAPDNKSSLKKQMLKLKILRYMNDLSFMSYKKNNHLRPFWEIPIIALAHLFINKKMVYIAIENTIQKFNMTASKKYVCNYLGFWGDREVANFKWFQKVRSVQFENKRCNIPFEYDKYLRKVYGDYMRLPPIEQRVPKHDAIFISLDKEYK